MMSSLMSCHVDSQRKSVLTKFTKNKRTESDHNSIITKFNLEWKNEVKCNKIEVFNFKDDIGMKKFKEKTSNNTTLSLIFENEKDIEGQAKKFLKRFTGILHQCFKKIKITPTTKRENELGNLLDKQKVLKSKKDEQSKIELEQIEEQLAEKLSEEFFGIVKDEVAMINSEEGGFNSGHLWKLKKKLSGKISNVTSAVMDKNGNLTTTREEIEKATIEHYSKILGNRQIKEGLEKHQSEREKLCTQRIEIAKKNKTPDWTPENVHLW